MPENYWSARQGRGPKANPSDADLFRFIRLTIDETNAKGHLDEWFGRACVDEVDPRGRAGVTLKDHIYMTLGYHDLYPLDETWPMLNTAQTVEDAMFDLIEYLHDHVSEGVKGGAGYQHNYNNCGYHYSIFDPNPAQAFLRNRVNPLLQNYKDGFRLSDKGRIEHVGPDGLDQLMDQTILSDDEFIVQQVRHAIALYRSRTRTVEDQRSAVVALAGVLERLRPSIRAEMLKGDERALFQLANEFQVRHALRNQKDNYEKPLWLSWMFYVFLSTIHLITRIGER